jgi:mRNA-degrading endonuclease RelE of RelBE toxin-antitoxin system
VRIGAIAQQHFDEFAVYLRAYSEDFAAEQIDRLSRVITNLAESPLMWSYFIFTGAPYRAYLFRVGRRTQYWIIYTVDDESRTVNVIHFWNATRDPEVLEL